MSARAVVEATTARHQMVDRHIEYRYRIIIKWLDFLCGAPETRQTGMKGFLIADHSRVNKLNSASPASSIIPVPTVTVLLSLRRSESHCLNAAVFIMYDMGGAMGYTQFLFNRSNKGKGNEEDLWNESWPKFTLHFIIDQWSMNHDSPALILQTDIHRHL